MDLLEYQGKQLFRKHGVPTPEGRHAATVAEAVEAAEELGYPVVVKAQVQIGGRARRAGSSSPRTARRPRRTPGRSSGWTSAASRFTRSTWRRPARSTRSATRRSCST